MASTFARFTLAAILATATVISASAQTPRPRVILLVGPPGSGKTTQAKFLQKKYSIPAFSMSDLLTKKLSRQSGLATKALSTSIASGDTLPDDAAAELVREHLFKADVRKGFILDGFPATAGQAKALDRLLNEAQLPRPLVVVLDVPDDVLRKRMLARKRVDDKPEIIDRRIQEFHNEASLLTGWVGETRVVHVNAVAAVSAVSEKVFAGLEDAWSRNNTLKVRPPN